MNAKTQTFRRPFADLSQTLAKEYLPQTKANKKVASITADLADLSPIPFCCASCAHARERRNGSNRLTSAMSAFAGSRYWSVSSCVKKPVNQRLRKVCVSRGQGLRKVCTSP